MKQRKKVIGVEYRKESESFPEWMKYEVTILNENGTTEKVPAYGKDLQDALSRVVHDYRIKKIGEKTKKIPDIIWVFLWFGYVFSIFELSYFFSGDSQFNGMFFIGGLVVLTLIVLWAKNWFKIRNKDKK
jgi:hypothetical protein